MSALVVRGPCAISGETLVPGDKSISHRALMLAAVADGASEIRNLGPGADVASTAHCLETYGVRIDRRADSLIVQGRGMRSWTPPEHVLDCGNSGSTMRMLAGFAAHYESPSAFDGDESLRRRPMDRLVKPLQAFGARVETVAGHAPLRVQGGRLSGADVDTGVASAQVKSCALFAALGAEEATTVREPAISRDHTERLLRSLGAPVEESVLPDGCHRIDAGPFAPPAFEIDVPGDPSSAAFLVAAAVIAGKVRIEGVGLNPTRIGFLELLRRMGAAMSWTVVEERMGEPVGHVEAARSELAGLGVEGPVVPVVLDELPLLAVIATQARGTTTVTGAEELRVKEADRISVTARALRAMGADIEERPDGFAVTGATPLSAASVDPSGDHRIAMALAVAGLIAEGETVIEGFECASVSWPGFERALATLGGEVELR